MDKSKPEIKDLFLKEKLIATYSIHKGRLFLRLIEKIDTNQDICDNEAKNHLRDKFKREFDFETN